MSLRALAPVVIVLAAVVCSCQESDPVILSLNGEEVRRSDFETHVATIQAQGLEPVDAEARDGLLEAFVEEQVLLIEARHQGLLAPGASPDEGPRAVSRLLGRAVPPPDISDSEISAYYAAHATEFRIPETVTVRQILVGTLNEARDLKRRLYREPRSFGTLAGSRSIGPEAAVGGFLGTFERDQLPRVLEEAAFALQAGQTSPPIESALGYHVLRVDSRQPARELSLEEAHERIRDRLIRERADAAVKAFVAGLLSRARVNHEAASSSSSR